MISNWTRSVLLLTTAQWSAVASVLIIITNVYMHDSAAYESNDGGSRAEKPVPGNKATDY